MSIRSLPQYRHAPLLTLISVCLMSQSLSTDTYVPALPALIKQFGVSASVVQLTLSMFVAGFGIAQFAVGPLSDRFGRRPVLLYGLLLYLAGSAMCAFAPSIWILIPARFVQAVGSCSAFIIGRAIIRDAYTPDDGMRAMVRASSWLSMAPILGPIIGSHLETWFGWRAIFGLHFTIAVGMFAAIFFCLPETNENKNPNATNIRGLIASYRFVLGQRVFWAYALIGALSFGSIFTFISGASIVLIRILGIPVTWFGYCFAIGTCGYLLGTMLCQRLLRRFNEGTAFRIGTTSTLAAGLLYVGAVVSGHFHWTVVVVAMFFTFGAHGLNSPVSQAGAVRPFPKHAGTAAGLSGALYMIAAAIISTITGATYNGSLYPLAFTSLGCGIIIFICARVFPELKKQKNGN